MSKDIDPETLKLVQEAFRRHYWRTYWKDLVITIVVVLAGGSIGVTALAYFLH